MADQKLVLGYWGIRGIAQPVRFLLEYTGLPYEDKKYMKFEDWFQGDMISEPQKNHNLVNLPYIKDGNQYIYESQALYVYIAHKAGKPELLGKDAEAQVRIAQCRGVLADLVQAFRKVISTPKEEFLAKKDELVANQLEEFVYKLNKFLDGKTWVAGDELSFVDFSLFEVVDTLNSFHLQTLQKYPNLANFHHQFADLPAIKVFQYFYIIGISQFRQILSQATLPTRNDLMGRMIQQNSIIQIITRKKKKNILQTIFQNSESIVYIIQQLQSNSINNIRHQLNLEKRYLWTTKNLCQAIGVSEVLLNQFVSCQSIQAFHMKTKGT
ncbi:hypothetical protein pb186bvf_001197 [Paramecium bursaria]